MLFCKVVYEKICRREKEPLNLEMMCVGGSLEKTLEPWWGEGMGNFQWFDSCFFLKKLDFMQLLLHWSYLTHHLSPKWNNFQGSELWLIISVKSTSSISGFCFSICLAHCLLNHQNFWSCGKILKNMEDGMCHHIFFHTGGLIPKLAAGRDKGRLCIANTPANVHTGVEETPGQALGEQTHVLQSPLWVTPFISQLNWSVDQLVTTFGFPDHAFRQECYNYNALHTFPQILPFINAVSH